MNSILFILYVRDQQAARDFYAKALDLQPTLDVPGMTEFTLLSGAKLGLMPSKNITKLITPPLPDPASGDGIPRCEVYFYVNDPAAYIERALAAGAKLVNPLGDRDWGDRAGYVADLDGHVVVFATSLARD
jgi:uncharacterized glyoxalase superfamily protein PhnB